MAHLIRPWIYRYVKEGKRVPKGTPGAKRKKERGRKWYGCAIPGYPKGKRVPLASDKTVAQQLLADLVRKGLMGQVPGLNARALDAHKTPLTDHIDDFASALRAREVSDKEVQIKTQRVRDAVQTCGFTYPRDIESEAVANYLLGRRRLPRSQGGISAQTSNFYLSALKQFVKWMIRKGRMEKDPLLDLQPLNVELDRRHDRRDLKAEELLRLLDAARASTRSHRGLSGEDRYWLYLTGCGTGFRAGELAALTPLSFDLGADPPTVTTTARRAKNRRTVVQPLPASVADGLRDYLRGKPADAPVWPGTWGEKPVKMLRKDLAEAGIPYQVKGVNGPLYADFHALRHTFVTMLSHTGASPKAAQALARHSDIRLTMQRYTHADRAALAEAANRLPLPGSPTAAGEAGPTAEQLAAALLLVGTALGCLLGTAPAPVVAPLVAPPNETAGDGPERPDTDAAVSAPKKGRRKSA